MRFSIIFLALLSSGVSLAEIARCEFSFTDFKSNPMETVTSEYDIELSKSTDFGWTGYIGTKEFEFQDDTYTIIANFTESARGQKSLTLNLGIQFAYGSGLLLESKSPAFQGELSMATPANSLGIKCDFVKQ
jgi:hypothetical protein